MIRFECPTCETKLRVEDEDAGELLDCPKCRSELRVPQESETRPSLKKKPRYRDEEDERPRNRPRPKKRKRKQVARELRILGFDLPTFISLVATAISFVFILASIAFLPLLFIPVAIGWLMTIVGGIWFAILAFQDDVWEGLKCMVIPFYSLVYLIQNYDYMKRPFILQMLAILILVVAGVVGGIFAKPDPAPAPVLKPNFRKVEQCVPAGKSNA